MDLLEKQLSKLNDEIDVITSDIRHLYSRLDSEQDTSLWECFKERITKLEKKETELDDRRRKLEDKLQPGGMPSKVRKNGMLTSMGDKLFYYRGQACDCVTYTQMSCCLQGCWETATILLFMPCKCAGCYVDSIRYGPYLMISTSLHSQDYVTCAGFEGDEKRKLDEVHQYTQEQKRAKSVLYLSNFKTDDMQRVAERAGLKFQEATLPERRKKRGIQGFGWDDRLEKAQHDW